MLCWIKNNIKKLGLENLIVILIFALSSIITIIFLLTLSSYEEEKVITYMSFLATLLGSLAMMAGVYVAWQGVGEWRKENEWKRTNRLAEQTLLKTFNVYREFLLIRHCIMYTAPETWDTNRVRSFNVLQGDLDKYLNLMSTCFFQDNTFQSVYHKFYEFNKIYIECLYYYIKLKKNNSIKKEDPIIHKEALYIFESDSKSSCSHDLESDEYDLKMKRVFHDLIDFLKNEMTINPAKENLR